MKKKDILIIALKLLAPLVVIMTVSVLLVRRSASIRQCVLVEGVLAMLIAIVAVYINNMRERRARLEEKAFTDLFINTYLVAFSVNVKDHSYVTYRRGDLLAAKYVIISDFFDMAERFISMEVVEEERDRLLELMTPHGIMEALEKDTDVTCVFRLLSEGRIRFVRLQVLHGVVKDQVAIGISDVTDTSMRDYEQTALLEGLSREYKTVWLLDSEGRMTHFRNSDSENDIGGIFSRQNSDYERFLKEYSETYVVAEDRERLLKGAGIRALKVHVPDDNIYQISFRHFTGSGLTGYYQMCFAKVKTMYSGDNYVVALRDIDSMIREEAKKQETLREALEEAKAANSAKSAFLSSMSHDIRTPMNAILNFTDMAVKNLDQPDKVRDYLEKAHRSGTQMLSIVNNVLDMSRIESGKVEVMEKETDLLEFTLGIMGTLKSQAEAKKVKLLAESLSIENRYVLLDMNGMGRVISNVISNAVKYTQAGGQVGVSIEQMPCDIPGKGLYMFRVADNGSGMSKEFLDHVFERFSREHTTTQSGIEGTGLGLAITKRLVDLAGGTITIDSAPGEGTTVTVIVPIKLWNGPAPKKVVDDADSRKEAGTLEGRRVLVVEDNELNSEITVAILEEEGMKSECAYNGKEAVEMVEKHPEDYYDVILMDIQMPVMDGYEATKHIRELPFERHIPIIALSANAFAEDRIKSIESGMDEHQSKPIESEQLIAAMKRILF